MACFTNVPVVSYAIPKEEEEEEDDNGEILGAWDCRGTDDGDEYFCSLKVYRFMTQI